MSRTIRKRPKVKYDLGQHASHIAQDSLDVALRFLAAAEQAFIDLARMPEMGSQKRLKNPRLVGLRMWPIHGFENYLVFYLPITNGIEVIRVIHAARDIPPILEKANP